MKEYYRAYEDRYQMVYEAGGKIWGHAPEDHDLNTALSEWVTAHGLSGKKIAEFACGEGAAGVVLSRLGCIYDGFDLAPSAIETAERLLKDFTDAHVRRLDMVAEIAGYENYDAALDVMGFHMLITDEDRAKYLRNVFTALKPGAQILFFKELYKEDAYRGTISSIEEWKKISDVDYKSPMPRTVEGTNITVMLPTLPARPRTKEDYIREFEKTGFIVDRFVGFDYQGIYYAAAIYAHKP